MTGKLDDINEKAPSGDGDPPRSDKGIPSGKGRVGGQTAISAGEKKSIFPKDTK